VQISDGKTEIYIVSQYFLPTENIGIGLERLYKVLRSLMGKTVIIGIGGVAGKSMTEVTLQKLL
jgi:hypothetical protein